MSIHIILFILFIGFFIGVGITYLYFSRILKRVKSAAEEIAKKLDDAKITESISSLTTGIVGVAKLIKALTDHINLLVKDEKSLITVILDKGLTLPELKADCPEIKEFIAEKQKQS